jgi:carbonic anhydrase
MKLINRRRFVAFSLGYHLAASPDGAETPAPAKAHAELAAGNSRFASGHARHPHSTLKWLRRTVRDGQHPHAVVLCCSDSRVAPEILFDQGIGDLFVVRVAGNVLREDEVASIEYAVEHLHVPLCLVLGHSGCGAVSSVVTGEHLLEEIEHLTAPIREALQSVPSAARQVTPRGDLVNAVVRQHALRTRNRIHTASAFLQREVARGRLRTEAAVFDLNTGRVTWI